MRLYGITIGGSKPVVTSTEILKETPKTYRVSGHQSWLFYRNVLSKEHDADKIFLNSGAAINAYIAEQENITGRLEHNLSLEKFYLEEAKKLKGD